MLDRLGLMSIFYHVTFCGKTCQLICQFCSRVLYENSDPNEKCRRMFKDVKLKDACNRDITAYLCVYLHFVLNKDYNSNCFKIINRHYLKYIEDKEKQKIKNEKT